VSAPAFPRTTHALRAALDERGFRPRKRHGQHFLTDVQAVDAIVRDAGVVASDRILEVGTGPGLLTHALAATGAEVVTFDVDPEIQAIARGLAHWPPTVSFRVGDVLADKHRIAPEVEHELCVRARPLGRTRVVSNLPYGSGTPILLGLLAVTDPPDDLVVMLQEEVADKILARAGDAEYGAPSAIVGLSARGEVLRRFGPEVFWPRPRVRSAVIRLVPARPAPLDAAGRRAFARFATDLFTHRRKILPQSVAFALPEVPGERIEAALAAVGVPRTARVQEVEPARLARLFEALSPAPSAPRGPRTDPRRGGEGR
jgi:16S rRNA (adenine1518-N6/adenine1519-N6)-dimethyltransferase